MPIINAEIIKPADDKERCDKRCVVIRSSISEV